MANNALLGSRISLISKKNIRYEGILYSINESDATVALQNVKSFGTEGRELLDTTGASTFVAPNDVVHNYLLFRGQDIKDLHVHEKQDGAAAAPDAKKEEAAAPAAEDSKPQAQQAPVPAKAAGERSAAKETKAGEKKEKAAAPPKSYSDKAKVAPAPAPSKPKQQPERGDSKENKPAPQQQKKGGRRNQPQVGTGASLLNRKARGAKGEEPEVGEDFDFDSNLAEFDKVNISAEEEGEYDEEGGDYEYDKDDFFDSISSDATDRAAGIDNRLRGAQERSLNLDTFGATSLNHGRRRGGRYGGRGRGGRGRGRGRGGRGRGRGGGGGYNRRNDGYGGSRHEQGSGPTPRQNNRWKESTPSY